MTEPELHQNDLDENELTAALHALAQEVEDRPVPWGELRGARPRWRGPMAAAAAVALLAGAGAYWWSPAPAPTPAPENSGPIASEPPARLVGHGSVAVEIPDDWATNDTRCGTPQSNTVVIDSVDHCFAVVPRPAGVESITVQPFAMMVDLVGEPVRSEQVLGSEATVWETTCRSHEHLPEATAVTVCTARVWMTTDDSVMFTAQAPTAERADALLSTLQRVPDHIGLLGPYEYIRSRMTEDENNDDPRAWAQDYAEHLRELGLEVSVTENDSIGQDVTVSPAPGTLVRPGSEVRVTYRATL